MSKNHVDFVLDLETAGTQYGDIILSIGVVKVDPSLGRVQEYDELKKNSFKQNISLDASLREGFKVKAPTLIWWMEQSEKARKEAFKPCTNSPLSMISLLAEYLREFGGTNFKIWGNDPKFDMGLLEAYYDKYNLPYPWKYSNVKCYRTLSTSADYDKSKVPNIVTAHDPVDDAIHEAQTLQAIWICNPTLKL